MLPIEKKKDTPSSENINNSENLEYNKPMRRSRLDVTYKKQTKRNILLLIGGIILVIGVGIFYGTPLITKLATVSPNYDKNESITPEDKTSFISPPVLSDTFSATNSAKITLNGTGEKGDMIKVYINDEYADKAVVDDDGEFTIKNFELRDGENTISAKAIRDDNIKSDVSNKIRITYLSKPLMLTIDSPQDGQNFADESSITIKGKSDANAKVTVNGFWAIVDANGNYTYSLTLKDGDNPIKVEAKDDAGNTSLKEIKITHNH